MPGLGHSPGHVTRLQAQVDRCPRGRISSSDPQARRSFISFIFFESRNRAASRGTSLSRSSSSVHLVSCSRPALYQPYIGVLEVLSPYSLECLRGDNMVYDVHSYDTGRGQGRTQCSSRPIQQKRKMAGPGSRAVCGIIKVLIPNQSSQSDHGRAERSCYRCDCG